MSARAQERHEALPPPPLRAAPLEGGRAMFSPSLEEHHPALGRIPHDRPHCLHRRFVLATSLAVVASLENGLRLSRATRGRHHGPSRRGLGQRLGSALCAEPVNVYLPADVERTVAETAGVEQATPQFFTQTVNQRLLLGDRGDARGGIDMETDFIVGPWLSAGPLKGSAAAGRHYLGGRSATHRRRPSIHSRIGVSLWAPLSQRDRASTRPSSWM